MKRSTVFLFVPWVFLAGQGAAWAQSAFAAAGVVESTQGGFRFPDGSLQLTAAEGGTLENVIRVSPSGGDFTSVEDALASIVSPSTTNRFLVLVGPGVYEETGLLTVQGYVHLRGAGPNVTEIRSTRTSPSQHTSAAAVWLHDRGRISDLAIRNSGGGEDWTIGVYVANGASRRTVLDNVLVEVDGVGGTGHLAVYTTSGQPSILRSTLRASGADAASSANTGLYLQNAGGNPPYPRALVVGSVLQGATDEHCVGTAPNGFGLQSNRHTVEIVDSVVCGTYRSIYVAGTDLIGEVRGSRLVVGSVPDAHLVTVSHLGALKIATSGLFYSGADLKFDAGSLTCVDSHKWDYTSASATCG